MAKVLVVDDVSSNRDILKIRLEVAGHDVVEASNGEEAMEILATLHPDIIFLDAMMPKLDGWQVCKRVKADPKTKDIPVIMLTACDQETEKSLSVECGADEYVFKPWNPGRINTVMEKFVKKI